MTAWRSARDAPPFDFHGLSITEMTPEALRRSSVARVSVPAGGGHPRARSRSCEKLYVVLEGEVSFRLDGEAIRLLPGDALAVEVGRWFSYANAGPGEAHLLLVHTPPFDLDAEEIVAP